MAPAYNERMTVVADGDAALEGLFVSAPRHTACVIAPPHPMFGGSMDSPVCAELAWALWRAGFPSLRFNYRGVAASSGSRQGNSLDVSSLRAAVDHMSQCCDGASIALFGYSFGAYLCSLLAAAEQRILHCVLVAPPTSLFKFDFKQVSAHGCSLTVVLAREDVYCDLDAVYQAMSGQEDRVHLVCGTDHFFSQGLREVGVAAVRALDPNTSQIE